MDSCSTPAHRVGKPVDIFDLIKKVSPTKEGITGRDVAKLFKLNGVEAVALNGRKIEDLVRYTSNGQPVIVRIADGSTDFSHFLVVDGVTIRNGMKVVAIRDPQGFQYFSPAGSFSKSFTGDVIYIKAK